MSHGGASALLGIFRNLLGDLLVRVVAAIVLAATVLVTLPSVAAASDPPCADSALSEADAVSLAKACDREVTVSSATSEISQMIAQPDGLLRMEQHVSPQRVRRDHGWVPLDTRLEQHADGSSVAPIASMLDVRFSGGGTGPLVTITAVGGSASMWWPGALPVPSLEGDTAVYRAVFPGVDLRMRATAAGFTQVLVVENRAAAADPALRQLAFTWASQGLTVANGAEGSVELRSGDQVVLASLPGMMWDSARTESGMSGAALNRAMAQGDVGEGTVGDESTPEAPGDLARTADVGLSLQGPQMLLTPNAALLDDPDTVFPLYIDPPWPSELQRWLYADSTNVNRNDGIARVGANPDGSGMYRSFFEFQLGSGINYKPVYRAHFNTILLHSSSCDPTTVSLWRATGISTSYGNGSRIPWSPSLTDHLHEQFGNANKGSCSDAPQDNDPMEFNGNLTAKVQQWTSSGWGSVVLALSTRRADGTGESNTYYWKKFDPTKTSMTIWYNTAPNTPTVKAFTTDQCYKNCSSPAVLRTTTPTLRVNVSDPDNSPVWTDFEVRTAASDTATLVASIYKSASVASGLDKTWTVPSGKLSNGSTYYWRARAWDEDDWSSAWTGWQQMAIDTSPPTLSATPVTSAQYPQNSWGAVVGTQGTFTLSSSSTDTAEFEWWVDGGSSAIKAASGTNPRTASVTWTPATDMVHTLYVKAKDNAGNVSTSTYAYQFWVAPLPDKHAHWSLDETSGTIAADSGNATSYGGTLAPLTLSGSGVAFGPGWVKDGSGQTTNGLVFTGNATASASGPVIDTTKAFTVMAWAKPSDLSADRTIVSLDGSNSSRFQLHFDKDGNAGSGAWCFSMRATDGATPLSACTDGSNLGYPTTTAWVHLAAVYDPALSSEQMRLYVMGDPNNCFDPYPETATATFTGAWAATGSLVIGRAKAGGAASEYWRGSVDDVWAFQRPLNGAEVCQHAQP